MSKAQGGASCAGTRNWGRRPTEEACLLPACDRWRGDREIQSMYTDVAAPARVSSWHEPAVPVCPPAFPLLGVDRSSARLCAASQFVPLRNTVYRKTRAWWEVFQVRGALSAMRRLC
jgi:hypothetical protein